MGGSEARLRRFAPLQGLGVRLLSKRTRSKTGSRGVLKRLRRKDRHTAADSPLGLVADGKGCYSRAKRFPVAKQDPRSGTASPSESVSFFPKPAAADSPQASNSAPLLRYRVDLRGPSSIGRTHALHA